MQTPSPLEADVKHMRSLLKKADDIVCGLIEGATAEDTYEALLKFILSPEYQRAIENPLHKE